MSGLASEHVDELRRRVMAARECVKQAAESQPCDQRCLGAVLATIDGASAVLNSSPVLPESPRQNERTLAAIIESSPDAIISYTTDGNIVSWNHGAQLMYGYTAEEMIGQPKSVIVPAMHQDEFRRQMDRALRGEQVDHFHTVRMHKDARLVHVSISISALRDERGGIVGAATIARDISERIALESEVLRISQMERNRIGRDLHDALGQYLTGVSFLGKALHGKLAARDLPEAADAKEITRLVNDAVVHAQALSRGLCPVDVREDGLMKALDNMATQMSELFGIECKFAGSQRVLVRDSSAATHLYHIAQEAANNAVKHGKARRVLIELQGRPDGALLSITDDGTGISGQKSSKGMGLRIMGYRASVVGGSLEVLSPPAGGTVVRCHVPARIAKVSDDSVRIK